MIICLTLSLTPTRSSAPGPCWGLCPLTPPPCSALWTWRRGVKNTRKLWTSFTDAPFACVCAAYFHWQASLSILPSLPVTSANASLRYWRSPVRFPGRRSSLRSPQLTGPPPALPPGQHVPQPRGTVCTGNLTPILHLRPERCDVRQPPQLPVFALPCSLFIWQPTLFSSAFRLAIL